MSKKRKQAAEWLTWLEDSDFSAGATRRYEAWRERSKGNRRAFRKMEQFSRELDDCRDALRAIPIPSREECDADTSAPPLASNRLLDHPASELPRFIGRLGDWTAGQRQAAAMAGIALLLAGVIYAIVAVVPELERDEAMLSYQTAVAEHRNIVLTDGSRVSIGARSSLSVNFSSDKRIVVLEAGEALFEVAHAAERPFIVMAGASTITAVGTAFNVRREGNRVVVTVTEGTVEVRRTPQEAIATAGDQTSAQSLMATTVSAGVQAVVSPGELSVVELSNPTAVTEWQIGHLQYRSEPLKYVVADVSRYTSKEIIIADTEVEAMIFTGSVYQDQTEDWLKALETAFPVEVTDMGDNKILIRKR